MKRPKFLPEIPHTWLIAALGAGCIILRGFGIDSMVTGVLMGLAGYLTGKHIEQTKYF